jgi:hypothetical protein
MAGFADALKKGLEAHQRAAEARYEMDEVLKAASVDIRAVTGAPISLRFSQIDRPQGTRVVLAPPLAAAAPREKVTGLIARHDSGDYAALAEVSFGELGYPVILRWENRADSAENRTSFEASIEALLAHSATGAKLAKLVSLG